MATTPWTTVTRIARGLNVSLGELRRRGPEGELTDRPAPRRYRRAGVPLGVPEAGRTRRVQPSAVAHGSLREGDREFFDVRPTMRSFLQRRMPSLGEALRAEPRAGEQIDIIVLGAGRFGGALLGPLRDAGHRVLVVDFDPRVVEAARAEDQPALYGDAEDPELPAALPLEGVRWVVSTVRRREVGLALLHALEHHGYSGGVALSAHRAEDAEDLRARGAHHVLRPYEAAAADAVAALTATLGTTAESPTPRVRTPAAEIVERSVM